MMLLIASQYSNPYYDQTFWGFFYQFVSRLWMFATGQLPLSTLAADEIQVLVLAGVAVSGALVGSFLVLRRMAMLANSLSHTILVGIVIAFILTRSTQHAVINVPIMLLASLIMGVLTAVLTELLHKAARLQEDASMGIVFTTLFAFGIILVTLWTRNAHIGAEVVMGNVDALHFDDLSLVYWILGINLLLFSLFFKEYKLTTFDPGLAKVLGVSILLFNYLLMVQVSATVVGAFRAVGVVMVLAFIVGPPLIARMLTHSLSTLLALAATAGVAASIIGVALSRHLLTVYGMALSTGGVVVCILVFFYLSALSWSLLRSRK